MAVSQNSYEELRLPGTTVEGNLYGVPFGDNLTAPHVQELLVSMVGYRQHGVVLAGAQGVLQSGQVLARVTSTGLYVKYNPLASDGSQNPLGFLRRQTDTTNGPVQANLVIAGEVRYDLVSSGGLDTNAITVLNGRVLNAPISTYGASTFDF